MDVSWLAFLIFILINVGGWCYALGKLNGRVKNLEGTAERHEKQLNEDGLSQQISNCEKCIANLDGSVRTYIALTKKQLGISEDP